MSLDIATFTAGFEYTFSVTAYNQLGSSSVQCDTVTHRIGTCLFQNSSENIMCLYVLVSTFVVCVYGNDTVQFSQPVCFEHLYLVFSPKGGRGVRTWSFDNLIVLSSNEPIPPTGIPQVPETPTRVSSGPGSVVLNLNTPASGRTPPGMFYFIVSFTQASTSLRMEDSRTLNAPDYMDGQDGQFTIDCLMEGEQYLFSAQARNQFGSSAFSGNSDFIEAGTGMLCVQCV